MPAFADQSRVILKGLVNSARYNGSIAVVVEQKEGDDRVAVILTSTAQSLRVKPENLELAPLPKVEKNDDDDDDDDIQILENGAGAIVCKKHTLEHCGACGMDFRSMNEERGVSAPIPKIKHVSALELGADDIDPGTVCMSHLKPWRGPLEMSFINLQFTVAEKLSCHAGTRPAPGSDVVFDVKETLVAFMQAIDSSECRTLIVQNKAQSEGIAVKAIEWHQWLGGRAGYPRPIVLCIYQAPRE
jgi:hypothetical protein